MTCPGIWDLGPNVLALGLAVVAAIVSMYAAYRTTHTANAVTGLLNGRDHNEK